MPLNLSPSAGDNTPYLKYNAKAGRFFAKFDASGGKEVEVQNPRLLFDMANIKTGYVCFTEGQGPERIWDPPGGIVEKPAGDKKFKRGFEVMVAGADPIVGQEVLGLREICSNAGAAINGILEMHAAYEAGMADNPGKVPFFAFKGVETIESNFGPSYKPVFELVSWVERSKTPFAGDSETPMPQDQGAPAPPIEAYEEVNTDPAYVEDDIPF